MSVPSSTVTLLTMMTFLLWLTVQLTSQPSLAYNLYPMPDNWEPLVVLNYTDNHNIASLLTGESLVPNATKCVSHLNTHLNASRVCKRQLYDWLKIEMDDAIADGIVEYWQERQFIRTYVKFTLTCYFRLACVHCPEEQVTEYRKAVEAWFPLYACKDLVCTHEEWQSPRLTECFDPPLTELAQCDAVLKQANATDKCNAQVQLKLNSQSSKEVDLRPDKVKCEAEFTEQDCMVGQMCGNCAPEHVHKYLQYWNKLYDLPYKTCKPLYTHQRNCPTENNYFTIIVVVGVVAAFLIVVFCCQTRNSTLRDTCSFKRTRKYRSLDTGRSSSKSRTTSRSSSSSARAK